MSDDPLLTLLFWLVAIVMFIGVYLVPVALTATGALLLKKRPQKRTLGLILLVVGALLCLGVILWRIFDFLSYGLG
jgi:uncharacterized membrane protein